MEDDDLEEIPPYPSFIHVEIKQILINFPIYKPAELSTHQENE